MASPMEIEKKEKKSKIDEGLYSRQLYVLGHEAMARMAQSNVLVVGLRGLGLELAKDIILAGVKSVTLHDNQPATLDDLSAQYYLTKESLGQPRAKASLPKLAELNSYVEVYSHGGELNDDFLKGFQVVVMTGQTYDLMLKVNEFCHQNNIAFIGCDTKGVFGYVFCDFGEKFTVWDTNGEDPQTIMISGVTKENPGVVTVIEDHRIPFEDGDFVQFTEVKGMTELNTNPPRKIKVLSQYTFSIEDTSSFNAYTGGGIATQVKQPKDLQFLPLGKAIDEPEFLLTDFAKMERPALLHLGFQALDAFFKKHGQYPLPKNEDHANEVIALAKEINEKSKQKLEQIDDKIVKLLSYGSRGEVATMTAVIGGLAAQETLKACSGKFMPIKQWLYFDAAEALPPVETPAEDFQPMGTRYDAQIATFGRTLHEKIMNLNIFLVGSGAIGCEVLKLWACMGVGSGPKGKIHVTDMDVIEKSNLSRQFLFRSHDVEQLKSKTAANAVNRMNPEIKIQAYSDRVGSSTEHIFNDAFYHSLDLVCNALDNVEARLYMDSQCILYKKPLLESGTLGTKGNTQVIVPFLTESYASSRDPPEKNIPICTLHHFPNAIEHTIQWARDTFEGIFRIQLENAKNYIHNPQFLEGLQKQPGGQKLDILNGIKSSLVTERPHSFEDCIKWARLKWEEYFNNNIQQLLYNFPLDMVTNTGAPFWSGPKRAPKPLVFNAEDPLHLDFVLFAANLRAFNYGLKDTTTDVGFVKKVIGSMIVPDFVPKKGIKIKASDNEQDDPASGPVDDEDLAQKILGELPSPGSLKSATIVPVDFEKDDDRNFHIDFITACSNLRATNYAIQNADRHKTKGIAGKIIPAMVTTTAIVSGLIIMELYKIIQGKKLEDYKNGFINLALPFLAFSEPIQPPKNKISDNWSWTLWDRFEVEGDMSLSEFIAYFKEKYQLEVTMVSCGATMMYSFFMGKDKLAERMPKKVSEVYSLVSKQNLPQNKNFLVLEICCNRMEDDEDVDVPFVKYNFRK